MEVKSRRGARRKGKGGKRMRGREHGKGLCTIFSNF